MTRFSATSTAVLIAAGALSACAPPHPHVIHIGGTPLKTISQLSCPDKQNELQRKSASADGRTCVYAGPHNEEVTLQLIDLKGEDASTALAPLTADLRAELPAAADKGPSSGGEKDNVDIDLPGIHIHAHDSGAHAATDAARNASAQAGDGKSVDIDEDSSVHVTEGDKGGVNINANDNGAEIHIHSNGEGNRMTFILASDTPGPHGYRVVGYEARGPSDGPLAVASVKSPSGEEGDELRHEVGQLLRLNVGG